MAVWLAAAEEQKVSGEQWENNRHEGEGHIIFFILIGQCVRGIYFMDRMTGLGPNTKKERFSIGKTLIVTKSVESNILKKY